MDLAAIANSNQSNISDAGVSQSVSTTMLKKAIDINQSTATQLLQAIPQPTAAPNLPSNLGKNINTSA